MTLLLLLEHRVQKEKQLTHKSVLKEDGAFYLCVKDKK